MAINFFNNFSWRPNTKTGRITWIIIVVVCLYVVGQRIPKEISVTRDYKDLILNDNILSIRLKIDTQTTIYDDILITKEDDLKYIKNMLISSEAPWKKEKRLYDAIIKMDISTVNNKLYFLTIYIDYNSSEINYSFRNKYGGLLFYYNDEEKKFNEYLTKYVEKN